MSYKIQNAFSFIEKFRFALEFKFDFQLNSIWSRWEKRQKKLLRENQLLFRVCMVLTVTNSRYQPKTNVSFTFRFSNLFHSSFSLPFSLSISHVGIGRMLLLLLLNRFITMRWNECAATLRTNKKRHEIEKWLKWTEIGERDIPKQQKGRECVHSFNIRSNGIRN